MGVVPPDGIDSVMPAPRQEFRILVSSPSDLGADRDAVEEAIDELNSTATNTMNSFRTIRWETDIVPGIGGYAQDVINRQLHEQYDILVALIGRRLGSATERSLSGTVEEIESAIKASSEAFDHLDVQVYFKNERIPISDIDIEDVGKVQRIKESLHTQGILYAQYEELSELQSYIRVNIQKIIRIFESRQMSRKDAGGPQADGSNVVAGFDAADDDFGLLDYEEMFIEYFEGAASHLVNYSEFLDKFAPELKEKTDAMTRANAIDDRSSVRKILRDQAILMDTFASSSEGVIRAFSYAIDRGFEYFSSYNALLKESFHIDSKEISAVLNVLVGTRRELGSLFDQIQSTMVAISAIPRIIKEVNQAKRHLLITTKLALDVFDAGVKKFRAAEIELSDLIEKGSPAER